MMNRVARVLVLLVWIEFGLTLVLLPWSDLWQSNYFVIQFPSLAAFLRSSYLRGAISGLGVMNVFFALESFRHKAAAFAKRH